MSRTIHLYRRGHRFCMGLALSFLATAAAGEAANWGQFQRSLKRAFKVQNDQFEMNLGDDG